VRTLFHLAALRRAGFAITLIGGLPPGERAPRVPEAESVVPVPASRWRTAAGLLRAALTGDPFQSALTAGSFARALSAAMDGDGVRLVVVLLARLQPYLRGAALSRREGPPRVVDYIDALAGAARQAARSDPALWRRLYWRIEAPRLSRVELEMSRGAAALVCTTPLDAELLPPGTHPLPHGVDVGPDPTWERPPLVAFSGRLRYRPNELAVRRLVRNVWPVVRREVPEAGLLLGGADAPGWIRALAGRDGIRVESPVADMGTFLRRARVVAAPLALGTGLPNKLLEAFEAGASVVAAREALERLRGPHALPPAVATEGDDGMALALIARLRDASLAEREGRALRAWAVENAGRDRAIESLVEIYREALVR
jgi:glycosyltransferase involved in cell wall biosynthesis